MVFGPQDDFFNRFGSMAFLSPILPLIDYQHAPYFGGSLVVGILAIPFFAALGPTLVALTTDYVFADTQAVAKSLACVAAVERRSEQHRGARNRRAGAGSP